MSSKKRSSVRVGVIGVGGMGRSHASSIARGEIARLELAAVCDASAEALAAFPGVPSFRSPSELIASGLVEAVVIATPHFSHTPIGIGALRAGLHVLVEKPISVHKADCERLIAAHRGRRQVFAAMFNQRTDPFYLKIRDLVRSGALGEVRRISWTITDWFRSEAYYASGGWRATWKGEGGGVLLNQAPHNIDLWQWMFGMPSEVRADCAFGRYHDIEVEDDVTAFFKYPNGATGVFITSTGEAPGSNRLEVAAENGRLLFEGDRLRFTRNEVPMTEFSRTTAAAFAKPPVWEVEIPLRAGDHGPQHAGILRNFAEAILDGAPLLAPAREGIRSVELANAMILSSVEGETVRLPLDGGRYERLLKRLAARSRPKKRAVKAAAGDLSASFNR